MACLTGNRHRSAAKCCQITAKARICVRPGNPGRSGSSEYRRVYWLIAGAVAWQAPLEGWITPPWQQNSVLGLDLERKDEDAMDDTRFDTEQVFTPNHYYYFFAEDLLPERIEREAAVI
jgi:hypothetical protein